MNDTGLTIGACILISFMVLFGGLAVVGIICGVAQCIGHCKEIWKREE